MSYTDGFLHRCDFCFEARPISELERGFMAAAGKWFCIDWQQCVQTNHARREAEKESGQ